MLNSQSEGPKGEISLESETKIPFPANGDRVLVVEDESRVRDMLSRALKEMGFHSTLAPTAEAGLKLLADHVFDIVILDLNLPGMDGMQFLQTIRRQKSDAEVIILTGFGDLEAAKKAIHLDVVDFITKPYSLGTLEVALDRARKRIRARVLAAMEPVLDEAAKSEHAPPARESAFKLPDAATDSLDELERRQILNVLEQKKGNRAETAAALGISLRKLYYRLGEYERRGMMS